MLILLITSYWLILGVELKSPTTCPFNDLVMALDPFIQRSSYGIGISKDISLSSLMITFPSSIYIYLFLLYVQITLFLGTSFLNVFIEPRSEVVHSCKHANEKLVHITKGVIKLVPCPLSLMLNSIGLRPLII